MDGRLSFKTDGEQGCKVDGKPVAEEHVTLEGAVSFSVVLGKLCSWRQSLRELAVRRVGRHLLCKQCTGYLMPRYYGTVQ